MTHTHRIALAAFALILSACSVFSGLREASRESIQPSSTVATAATKMDWLMRILEPDYGAVVDEPSVILRGEAKRDTVISCNDEFIYVEEEGPFVITVPLEEGPNEIQCTASDSEGNEQDISWLVDYQPS